MFFLPNDILLKIVNDIDIMSVIVLRSVSKEMKDTIDYLRPIIHKPIFYINNHQKISCKYINLTSMIHDIYKDIITSRNYTTYKNNTYFTLQIEKTTRYYKNKPIELMNFTIKSNYNSIKILYDYTKNIYIFRRKKKNTTQVPLLFMFIGYKTLFMQHGFHNVYGLNNCPTWFLKVLLTKSYNGNLIYDLIHNVIDI